MGKGFHGWLIGIGFVFLWMSPEVALVRLGNEGK